MSARPFIPFTCDAELAEIGRGVLQLSLPKARWTHAAHFAVALWLISCRQDLDASRAMPGFIRAYNEATGVANSRTLLFSVEARRGWVEPDLKPLPF